MRIMAFCLLCVNPCYAALYDGTISATVGGRTGTDDCYAVGDELLFVWSQQVRSTGVPYFGTGVAEVYLNGEFDGSSTNLIGYFPPDNLFPSITGWYTHAGGTTSYEFVADGAVFNSNQTGCESLGVSDLQYTVYVEGDANKDGAFTTGDLVSVFQAGEYEDSIADNSTWSEGDWNGDADFTSSDLVVAHQSPMSAIVPEPQLGFILCLPLLMWRKRQTTL